MEIDENSRARRPSNLSRRAFFILCRLVVWYTVVTAVFRCPESAEYLTDESPALCKPYFQARARLDPHLKPYYDTYAGPYVEATRPYVESVYTRVYVPASAAGVQAYAKYGAPRLSQARLFAEQQWEKNGRQIVDGWYGTATTQYKKHLGPGVESLQAMAGPFGKRARNLALHQYKQVLFPTYQRSLPYGIRAYEQSRLFATDTALPYSKLALESSWRFVRRRIWPHLRVLYGRNVEPQLSKIKERLSSYRDGKRLEAVIEAMDEPSTSTSEATTTAPTTSSSSLEASAPLAESVGSVLSSFTSKVASTFSSLAPAASTMETGTAMSDDLKRWQAKLTRASDKGAEDLAERIAEIASDHMRYSVQGHGAALVTELEEMSSSAIVSLKAEIVEEVSSLGEDGTAEEQVAAYDTIHQAIRTAGKSIKDKAQEVRTWKHKSNVDLESLVQAASESTLDVIDGIRDLGLQEIGLRWAALDHATYQDWAEYHKLKKTIDDWRAKVSDVASEHEGVKQAKTAADEMEDGGMAVAQDVAKELSSLRDVAKWKIHARDATDDFTPRTLPAAAALLGQKAMSKVNSAVDGVAGTTSSQSAAESIMSAGIESASSMAARISEAVVDPISEAAAESTMSFAGEASRAATYASEAIVDPILKYASMPIVSSASSMGSTFSSSTSKLSSAALSSASPPTSSLGEATDALASSDLSAISSAVSGMGPLGSLSASASSIFVAADADAPPLSSSSPSSSAESILSAASEGVVPQGNSIMAAIDQARSTASSAVLHGLTSSSPSAASSAGTNIVPDAASGAASVVTSIGEGATSFVSAASASISTAATLAPSAAQSGARSAYEDVVDGAASASESILSRVRDAGSVYETVTETLRQAAHV